MSFYDVLGVERAATASEIRLAYRRAAQQWHPDRNPGKETEAHQRFIEAHLAYKTLSDAHIRHAYDSGLELQACGTSASLSDLFELFERMLIDLFCDPEVKFEDAVAILIRQGFPAGVAHAMAENAYRCAREEEGDEEIPRQDPRTRDENRAFSKAISSALVIAMLLSMRSPGNLVFAPSSAEKRSRPNIETMVLKLAPPAVLSAIASPGFSPAARPPAVYTVEFNSSMRKHASGERRAMEAQYLSLRIDEALNTDPTRSVVVDFAACDLPDSPHCPTLLPRKTMPHESTIAQQWEPPSLQRLPLQVFAGNPGSFQSIPYLGECCRSTGMVVSNDSDLDYLGFAPPSTAADTLGNSAPSTGEYPLITTTRANFDGAVGSNTTLATPR